MPLPVPNLDDRRFDDLVSEAQERLKSHLPELTRLAPGDPLHSFVDLMAWMTETILYRANLIPERQRRVILNMLQVPLRPAQPAHGVICIDARPRSAPFDELVEPGVQLRAGTETFTGIGELRPTPLNLTVTTKRAVDTTELEQLGFSLADIREQFGIHPNDTPLTFQPRAFEPGKELLTLAGSIDGAYYLGLSVPRQLRGEIAAVQKALAGTVLNFAVAPADDVDGDEVGDLLPRALSWELLSRGENGDVIPLALEVIADSSDGGRRAGVVRLRLPRNDSLFDALVAEDPMFAGFGDLPPEPPAQVPAGQLVCWLRLSSADEPDLELGYLGINGLEVVGQGQRQNLVVGIGDGQPGQAIRLPDRNVAADSLELAIEEDDSWAPWRRVDFLAGAGPDDRVFRLDPASGLVHFGDGVHSGRRVPAGRRIRVERYRYGGGSAGNLEPGAIRELTGGRSRLGVRHEWPTRGGVDAESVEMAERRIPQFLTHRNRAVTRQDFKFLAESNPLGPVGRADVIEGFLPGASIEAARSDVPGAVSVFLRPPGAPRLGATPKPTRGLLKDVFGYLLQRVVLGTELYVLSPDYLPLAVGVTLEVRDPETGQQTLAAVQRALTAYLWQVAPGGAAGDGWPLGGAVRANELATQVARVTGVRAVNALRLFVTDGSTWRKLPAGQALSLERYQLPELLAVGVSTGSGEPGLPAGLTTAASDRRSVPAPVIPDVC